MSELKLCPKCDSPRIIRIRLDTDWGDGGDVYRENTDEHYLPGDHEDGGNRPDIEIYHCEACGWQGDRL